MRVSRRHLLAGGAGLIGLGAVRPTLANPAGQTLVKLAITAGCLYVIGRDDTGRRSVEVGFPSTSEHPVWLSTAEENIVRFDPGLTPTAQGWQISAWRQFSIVGPAGAVAVVGYGQVPSGPPPNTPAGWRPFGYVADLGRQFPEADLAPRPGWQQDVTRLSLRGGTLAASQPSHGVGLDSAWEFGLENGRSVTQPLSDTTEYTVLVPGETVTIRVWGKGDLVLAPSSSDTTLFLSLAGDRKGAPPGNGCSLEHFESLLALVQSGPVRIKPPVRRLVGAGNVACTADAPSVKTPGRFCPGLQVLDA